MATELKEFVCPKCGGKLFFDPAYQQNACPNCGNKYIINPTGVFEDVATDQAKSMCTNCGANLLFDPSTQTAKCMACSSEYAVITEENTEKFSTPENIYPFGISRDEFRKSFLQNIAQQELIPEDIFEQVKISSEYGAYFPFYNISGDFKVSYTCSIGTDREEEYTEYETETYWMLDGNELTSRPWGEDGNRATEHTRQIAVIKTRTVTDWAPFSSNLQSTFCIGDCIATDEFKGQGYDNFIERNGNSSDLNTYDERLLAGFSMFPINLSEEKVYSENYYAVKGDISRQIEYGLPGDHFKDIKWNGDVSQSISTKLKPFWIVIYKYNDIDYFFINDGTNTNKGIGSFPENNSKKSIVDNIKNEYMERKKQIDEEYNQKLKNVWAPTMVVVVLGIFATLFSGIPVFITTYNHRTDLSPMFITAIISIVLMCVFGGINSASKKKIIYNFNIKSDENESNYQTTLNSQTGSWQMILNTKLSSILSDVNSYYYYILLEGAVK
jgi:DNA-directed RNA polymerase subunit RPC12/RpoP